MPDSLATICCVLKAILAASCVGNPKASSKPLVCKLCVPPSTAAIVCIVTLLILFKGCCAVKVAPPVCV